MIEIISQGMLSTIQDSGRFGAMKNGFTQSGAMDVKSMKIANRLVGNSENAPVIEMTLMGVTARFIDAAAFAVSGGAFDISLNDESIKQNKTYFANSGDILKIGSSTSGLRCYLAVSGGFVADSFLGSVATDLKSAVGGIGGKKLTNGDRIEFNKVDLKDIKEKEIPCEIYNNNIKIRCVRGPQDDMFTKEDFSIFFGSKYTVTPQSDRMGMRLDGKPLSGKNGMDIISDGIVFGSVQVPKNGLPIILLADHQTTGGYAKIATVISSDLALLAQARPGDVISFAEISVKEAEKIAIKEKKYISKI